MRQSPSKISITLRWNWVEIAKVFTWAINKHLVQLGHLEGLDYANFMGNLCKLMHPQKSIDVMNVPARRYCSEQIDLLATRAILRFNIYCLSITVLMDSIDFCLGLWFLAGTNIIVHNASIEKAIFAICKGFLQKQHLSVLIKNFIHSLNRVLQDLRTNHIRLTLISYSYKGETSEGSCQVKRSRKIKWHLRMPERKLSWRINTLIETGKRLVPIEPREKASEIFSCSFRLRSLY